MAGSSFFNNTFGDIIHQEAISHFQKQLTEKIDYLEAAKAAFVKASDLTAEIIKKITLVAEQLTAVEKALENAPNSDEIKKFQVKKEKLEHYIKSNTQQLGPYNQRLQQLFKDIETVESEINTLLEQSRVLGYSTMGKNTK